MMRGGDEANDEGKNEADDEGQNDKGEDEDDNDGQNNKAEDKDGGQVADRRVSAAKVDILMLLGFE
nr:hypothetical protein [Tanacetum cinerariifolium]